MKNGFIRVYAFLQHAVHRRDADDKNKTKDPDDRFLYGPSFERLSNRQAQEFPNEPEARIVHMGGYGCT